MDKNYNQTIRPPSSIDIDNAKQDIPSSKKAKPVVSMQRTDQKIYHRQRPDPNMSAKDKLITSQNNQAKNHKKKLSSHNQQAIGTQKQIASQSNSDKKPTNNLLKNVVVVFITVALSLVVVYIVVNFNSLFARATFREKENDILGYLDGYEKISFNISYDRKSQLIFLPILLGFPDPETEIPSENEEDDIEDISQATGDSRPSQRSYTGNIQTTTNNQIFIASLGIKAPVVWNSPVDEGSMLANLQHGVVHYAGTALPGDGLSEGRGNIFISGHSSYYSWDPGGYKSIFATLPNISIGDQVAIGYNDRVYVFAVYERFEVTPDDVSVVGQDMGKHVLSIMTCVPIGTNERRFIARAEFIGYAE
jgi:LPXTG-site transpeptidase (sortase) family protein